jgi:hypothetical protein
VLLPLLLLLLLLLRVQLASLCCGLVGDALP